MYKIVILAFLVLSANAANLTLTGGEIKAHTEVFGDDHINPSSKSIESHVTINNTIDSMKGKISIAALSLKSDNDDRDKHMYEAINAKTDPIIAFEIQNVTKVDTGYKINGVLKLNGVSKNIASLATIADVNNTLNVSGLFSINLTDFKIEPPRLLFLTVRNQIDITYNLTYKK